MCYFDLSSLMFFIGLSGSLYLWLSLYPSGGFTITVTAAVGNNVLFNVSCTPYKQPLLVWQRNLTIVSNYQLKSGPPDDHYKGRTQNFLENDEQNCSLLLFNASLLDEGTYECFYYTTHLTNNKIVLEIAANYTERQCSSIGGNRTHGTYQCGATGGYPKGHIKWLLNGQPVPSTSDFQRENQQGLFNMSSTLVVATGAEVVCVVENPRLSKEVDVLCTTGTSRSVVHHPETASITGSVVGALGGLIGVGTILLWKRRRCPHQPMLPESEEIRMQTQPINQPSQD